MNLSVDPSVRFSTCLIVRLPCLSASPEKQPTALTSYSVLHSLCESQSSLTISRAAFNLCRLPPICRHFTHISEHSSDWVHFEDSGCIPYDTPPTASVFGHVPLKACLFLTSHLSSGFSIYSTKSSIDQFVIYWFIRCITPSPHGHGACMAMLR